MGPTTDRRIGAKKRSRPFSAYLRSLDRDGGPRDASLFDRLWDALKNALIVELRRRGLWTSPPRYLGLVGSDSWDEAALEELTAEAYTYNFVDRLRSLRAQLEVKPNVDGLVRLNLKNFLYEKQRRHDPLGHRLFQVLQTALRELVASGDLRVEGEDGEIRNESVLAFAAPSEREDPDPSAVLASNVARWSDELLPDLVIARGRQRDEVTSLLGVQILDLRDAGVPLFTVKELADPLKLAVRERWRALAAPPPDEAVAPSRRPPDDEDRRFERIRDRYQPYQEIENRDRFEKLIDCVEGELDRVDSRESEVEYLNTLWRYLRLYAVGERDLPSRRKLGELLGIPRNRFPELYGKLGDLMELCRSRLSGRTSDDEGRTG